MSLLNDISEFEERDQLVRELPHGDNVLLVVHAIGYSKVGATVYAGSPDPLDAGDVEDLLPRQRQRQAERVAPADRAAPPSFDRLRDTQLPPYVCHSTRLPSLSHLFTDNRHNERASAKVQQA